MKVLGIDPAFGKDNAYCIFEKDRVIEWGKFKSYEDYQKILLKNEISLVAIENVYYNEKLSNPEMFKKLCKVIGVLEYIATSLSFAVKFINPISWQTSINLRGNGIKRSRGRDEWVISVAKGLICRDGFYKLSIDEASAIHIASFAARH